MRKEKSKLEKSTHVVEVVQVYPKPHPNADRLDVVEVFGYTAVTQKGNFQPGDLGVYIPPDSLVPETKTFEFLWEDLERFEGVPVPERRRRIKAKRLRGIMSEGLLLPLKGLPLVQSVDSCGDTTYHKAIHTPMTNWSDYDHVPIKVGDNLAEYLGITHYDPPELGGDCEVAPGSKKKGRRPRTLRGWIGYLLFKMGLKTSRSDDKEETGLSIPDYDVDAYKRYYHLLNEGEEVLVTEKIHGSNSRFVFRDGRMYVGSHHQWKKNVEGSMWWKALACNPWIAKWCEAHPDYVVYGELVPTQELNYGYTKSNPHIFIFDIRSPKGHWAGTDEIHAMVAYDASFFGLEKTKEWEQFYALTSWVPVLGRFPFEDEKVRKLVDGKSQVVGSNHAREGIVIKPIVTRYDQRLGRIILKIVSPVYLEKA